MTAFPATAGPHVPTWLRGPLSNRPLDCLDLAVLEAMLLQGMGPRQGVMKVHRAPGVATTIELSAHGRAVLAEMAATTDPADLDGWMEILAPGLVEEAVAVAGEDWRAEAELAVELTAAERADDMVMVARLAESVDLVVDESQTPGVLLAAVAVDWQMALLV